MRKSGILMHLASLPSEYGSWNDGAAARKFADFLAMQDSSIAASANLSDQLR